MKPTATKLVWTTLALSAFLVTAGCSKDDGETDGGAGSGGTGSDDPTAAAPDTWSGSEPHVDLHGNVRERQLDLVVEGADAADLGTAYCERNYKVPDLEDTIDWADQGLLEKVEIKVNFFFDDALAEFQMELVTPNLPDEIGTTFDVPGDAEVNIGITVDEEGPNAAEYEDAAIGGSATLHELDGEVGDDGLTIPDEEGTFGLFVDVELESGGAFKGSLTVNCGENDLETLE
jgi:hypothetical protein